MNNTSGKKLSGLEHLNQSIADILSTPRGTRVMRRNYGAAVFDFIDAPGNPFNAQRIIAASADAIARWEPRLRLTRIQSSIAFNGRGQILVEGETTEGIKFSDVFVLGGSVGGSVGTAGGLA
ncbi:GPW/gp25 family protein [Kiloniella laminariae]|uniref:GPW/gp25 family protein n=1 Tax=Kiloniella laminariae TaxID=454162 RepID=A0ABT4LKV1_9PROT|nr:GPW/gp25 family protein [Kiloniella laminariae]MCZ4281702.1 GPW/gp25 family protein [Kiloniella laminariae]